MGMDRDMDRIARLGNEARNQVIRELIEKALGSEADLNQLKFTLYGSYCIFKWENAGLGQFLIDPAEDKSNGH